MVNFLTYLSKHILLNLLICIVFYMLVTLPHEFVGVSIAALFKGVSRAQYDLTIFILALLLFAIFTYNFIKAIRQLDRPAFPFAFFVFCFSAMIASLNMIIIVNIEIIHFIQYAVLACILFPLFKSFFPTLLATVILGAIDEAYQYYYLSPERTNYYDFNDVILNLLGGAMGLIYLRALSGIKLLLRSNLRSVHFTSWIVYFSIISIMFLLIIKKNLVQDIIHSLGLSLNWSTFGSVLVRKPTNGFWTEIPPKIIYHVVQPLEGVIIVTILLAIFSFLYKYTE